MSQGGPSRTRAALATLLLATAPVAMSGCDAEQQETNAAANAVELARYLPGDTTYVQTVDIAKAREELDLPDDANALPTSNKTFPRPKSPEAVLFQVTSGAYPDVGEVLAAEFSGKGASPLDGTLVRAAAGGDQGVSIVSTEEPLGDVEKKLELAGYARRGPIYVARGNIPEGASKFVANAGSGRFVFAHDPEDLRTTLRRVHNDAPPGEAAEALEPAAGSVRVAMTDQVVQTHKKKPSCVTAFAGAKEATGEGAALALIISGEKPDPDRFDPRALSGLATGTPTVLVDALLVPIRVKKPLKDGLDVLAQVLFPDEARKIRREPPARGSFDFEPAPFKSYDCP